jgi:VIT1/CCC1 family predicted Fe2+/Mn2+ transporter
MIPLATGAQHSLPFVGPGTYLVFGIILLPIYLMVIAWFAGEPSDRTAGWLGVGYLAALTTALWGGLFALTMVIKFAFF